MKQDYGVRIKMLPPESTKSY